MLSIDVLGVVFGAIFAEFVIFAGFRALIDHPLWDTLITDHTDQGREFFYDQKKGLIVCRNVFAVTCSKPSV